MVIDQLGNFGHFLAFFMFSHHLNMGQVVFNLLVIKYLETLLWYILKTLLSSLCKVGNFLGFVAQLMAKSQGASLTD